MPDYNLIEAYENGTIKGWEANYEAIRQFHASLGDYAEFSKGAAAIAGSGEGKTVLLHEIYRELVDPECKSHNQGSYGTCVSQGYGLGVDVLQAVEIKAGEREKFVAKCSTEYIYGISRVEVGGGRIRGDGSNGSWAAEGLMKYGTLHRLKYLSDKYDLTRYSGDLSRVWGRNGVPNELEPIGKEHPVRSAVLVRSYEAARDAIANGYPVPVCSNYGFRSTRDKDGFCRPSGSWSHCMLFVSVDDAFSRPGLLCWNSWGEDWVSGPIRHNQPLGSFWVDAEVADAMLRQDDSYALSGYEGFKSQELDYDLF
jgi:hypothetical protein